MTAIAAANVPAIANAYFLQADAQEAKNLKSFSTATDRQIKMAADRAFEARLALTSEQQSQYAEFAEWARYSDELVVAGNR